MVKMEKEIKIEEEVKKYEEFAFNLVKDKNNEKELHLGIKREIIKLLLILEHKEDTFKEEYVIGKVRIDLITKTPNDKNLAIEVGELNCSIIKGLYDRLRFCYDNGFQLWMWIPYKDTTQFMDFFDITQCAFQKTELLCNECFLTYGNSCPGFMGKILKIDKYDGVYAYAIDLDLLFDEIKHNNHHIEFNKNIKEDEEIRKSLQECKELFNRTEKLYEVK